MSINNILSEIDAEISRLEKVRSLLGSSSTGKTKKAAPVVRKKRRKLSKEAREKIAAAQRKRWAKQKKEKAPF